MTDSPELLPCPFPGCGSKNVKVYSNDYEGDHPVMPFAYVVCDGCSATGPRFTTQTIELAEAGAVEMWNDRRSEPPRITREKAIDIAKLCAFRSKEPYGYLPDLRSIQTWVPHQWVIEAIMSAAQVSEPPPRITAEMAQEILKLLRVGEGTEFLIERLASIAAQSPEQGGAKAQADVFDEERDDFIEYLHKSGAEDNASTFAFWKGYVKGTKAKGTKAEAQPVAWIIPGRQNLKSIC